MFSMFPMLWIVSMIAATYIAAKKNIGPVWFFIGALFVGPLAVIVALLVPKKGKSAYSNASYGTITLEEAKRQLQDLKYSLWAQEEKIKNLEKLINQLPGTQPIIKEAPQAPVSNQSPAASQLPEPVISYAQPLPAEPEPVKKSDMELDFGRNWLSKIGMIVLALGVAFLISYTFKYFGPFLKIAFGYLVAGMLFFVGTKLEVKENLKQYGRGLLGGAWAIAYFTTYAMHHFDASRIIASQNLDAFLLALVVAGMMVHALKYASESMMSVVVMVAYLTLTIGKITTFTLFSLIGLALLVLFLVYRFQWYRILSLGILLTYGVHLIWVMPNLDVLSNPSWMNFIFLTSYWLVFFVGVHLIKAGREAEHEPRLAVTNLANAAVYSVLAYPLVLSLFYSYRFEMVAAVGAIYLIAAIASKMLKQEKMFLSNIVAAIFALTYSVTLKFAPTTSLLIWFIEVPFLLFIGANFKERIYRLLAYVLTVSVAIKLVISGVFNHQTFDILGHTLSWYGFMGLWGAVSMGLCLYLTQWMKREEELDSSDALFDHLFAAASCTYLTIWLCSWVREPWMSFALSLEGIFFLGLSIVLSLKRFRAYAYAALGCAALCFLSMKFADYYLTSQTVKWFVISFNALVLLLIYYGVKYLKQSKTIDPLFEGESDGAFVCGAFVLTVAMHQHISYHWISLSMGVLSVVLILIGFLNGNKTERLGGMVLLGLTLGRVVFIDLSGLDIIFKIITLIVLGVLFLGVSYVYNRFSVGNKPN